MSRFIDNYKVVACNHVSISRYQFLWLLKHFTFSNGDFLMNTLKKSNDSKMWNGIIHFHFLSFTALNVVMTTGHLGLIECFVTVLNEHEVSHIKHWSGKVTRDESPRLTKKCEEITSQICFVLLKYSRQVLIERSLLNKDEACSWLIQRSHCRANPDPTRIPSANF